MTKKLIIKWLLFTIMTFLLYDVLWFAVDYGDFSWSVLNHSSEIIEDLAYCSIFSLTSILICNKLIKTFEKHQHITHLQLVGMEWLTIGINVILALLCEFIYEDVICNHAPDDDFWGNSYIFAFIASFIGMQNINHYYIRIIERQYKEYISFRKKSLKAQLNPHFLFNSLNVLAELTREDGSKAEEFTFCLSNVYRYVIRTIDVDTIPLSEAVIFVKNYTDILCTRFGESVEFHIADFKIGRNEYILPMSIQILIENAIKHNSASYERPLSICIEREGDNISVSNNLQPYKNEVKKNLSSFGIGLKNLHERSMLECGNGIDIKRDEKTYKVYIPIIKK